MSEKLKPCPFCGSRAYMYEKKTKSGWLAEISCWHKYDGSVDECVFKPSLSTIKPTEIEARNFVKEAWNKRAETEMAENKDKPKSCYDCTKSNSCELFEKNCFRVVLDKSRLRGCPYDGKTYRG